MYLLVGSMRCSGGDEGCAPRLASHLYLRITDGRLPGDPASDVLGTDGLRATRAQAASGGLAPYTIPRGPIVAPRLDGGRVRSRLPEEGERLDDGLDSFLGGPGEPGLGPAVLPEGARSLIAPAIPLDCNGGLVAVARVPGGPVDAIASFDPDAIDRVDTAWMREGTSDGIGWAAFRFDTAGGYQLMTTAIATGDDSSIVLATECGD
jgi:hypothetical protein